MLLQLDEQLAIKSQELKGNNLQTKCGLVWNERQTKRWCIVTVLPGSINVLVKWKSRVNSDQTA